MLWDFPDGPVFKTPHFRARVVASIPVRDLWSHMPLGAGEKKKKKKKKKQRIMLYLTADVILDLMEISIFHQQNPTY